MGGRTLSKKKSPRLTRATAARWKSAKTGKSVAPEKVGHGSVTSASRKVTGGSRANRLTMTPAGKKATHLAPAKSAFEITEALGIKAGRVNALASRIKSLKARGKLKGFDYDS